MEHGSNYDREIKNILSTFKGETFYCESLDQRGVASLIESEVQLKFSKQNLFEYHDPKSVRSIDDFTLSIIGHNYLIDVKTHDLDRSFSMPNLISTERLYKLYQDQDITFGIMILDYEEISKGKKKIKDTKFFPIENISWESLSIQNLGHGQIQITDLSKPIKLFKGTRDEWLSQFSIEMVKYQDKLMEKIKDRKEKWLERTVLLNTTI